MADNDASFAKTSLGTPYRFYDEPAPQEVVQAFSIWDDAKAAALRSDLAELLT